MIRLDVLQEEVRMGKLELLRGCFGNWHVRPSYKQDFVQADVILVHEFGDQKIVSRSTQHIADEGAFLSRKYNKPCICQHPTETVIRDLGVEPIYIIRRNEFHSEMYLDTDEVNRQTAEICAQHGWKRVIICTHPHHLWRASRNLLHHGLIPVIPNMEIPYDQMNPKFVARYAPLFMLREVGARLLYFLDGLL